MNTLKRPGIYAGFTSLVLMSAVAAPALAQTKTFPPGTDCSKLGGADMTACQNEMANQQKDSVGGASDPSGVTPNTTGGTNQVGPNGATPNTNGATQNAPSGRSDANGPSGSANGNTDHTDNP
jgi:hypothetical protein